MGYASEEPSLSSSLPSTKATLDRNDQQFVMSTFAGVAADLCSFLLASSRPEDALEYLERGRTAIISQLLDRRSDISVLAKDHPTIARQYESLVNEVNTPLHRITYDTPEVQATRRRRKAATELEACISANQRHSRLRTLLARADGSRDAGVCR